MKNYSHRFLLIISVLSVFSFLNLGKCFGQSTTKKKNVAIFIHEAVEILDFTGPAEAFSKTRNDSGNIFNVYTVAATKNEITSNGFLKITPNYSIENCPKPDIIILPGGDTDIPLADDNVINWIKKSSQDNTIIMSVCTGAFLLAKAGLLDGKKATTHYCCQEGLAQQFPKVNVVKGIRFIDNGNILTTEGISAGIDGSLHLITRLYGIDIAKGTAKYMMYNWRDEMFEGSKKTTVYTGK